MDRLHAIIAHTDPDIGAHLANALERTGQFQVLCRTGSGLTCYQEILARAPHLLVLDAALSDMDALELLRRVRSIPGNQTRFLLYSPHGGALPDHLLQAGADGYIQAPCDDAALLNQALSLFGAEVPFPDQAVREATAAILRRLVVRDGLKGVRYAPEGVLLLYHDPDLIYRRKATSLLYPAMGRVLGDSAESVDRNMRSLIRHIWTHNSAQALSSYFGPLPPKRTQPTLTTFLLRLTQAAEALLRQEAESKRHRS